MKETFNLSKKFGVKFNNDPIELWLEKISKMPYEMTSSMYIDFTKNKKLELNWLSGSIVDLCKKNDIECKLCHTGFKWIADIIEKEKNKKFLCGGEESFGFLYGSEVRDKDAVATGLLFCDMFSFLKSKGKTVINYLINIYKHYGFHYDKLHTITRKGANGNIKIKNQIEFLTLNPPKEIAGINVSRIDDYKVGIIYFKNGKKEKLELPKSNLIIYHLQDNSRISVRPSGTEPKIKFYINLYAKFNDDFDLNRESFRLGKKFKQIIKHFD